MLKGKWLIIALVFAGSFWLEGLSFAEEPIWGPDVRLTDNSGDSGDPAITTDANGLHVV